MGKNRVNREQEIGRRQGKEASLFPEFDFFFFCIYTPRGYDERTQFVKIKSIKDLKREMYS